ncbi:hypothetical protein [Methanosarcina sp. 2.H.A.1B.4]|uniref:hypothetical protein n=1 Tax=Methanosarcina sp. 2.H.A.1B.4 TaxID=1483600 RepID=UPI0006218952|nr:hypothetical protein [Methanosarcina sp. 2.H.A.1B.4]KKG09187.1 hypothetical protein EO92_00970 [Methanosarcina sp. 2.H.A.1B.4]
MNKRKRKEKREKRKEKREKRKEKREKRKEKRDMKRSLNKGIGKKEEKRSFSLKKSQSTFSIILRDFSISFIEAA